MTAASGWMSERGLSLVEVTIMLVILLILAGTLVPVMSDSVNSARSVRARNDLSQLAVALVNFQRDVGPVVFDGHAPAPVADAVGIGAAPCALLTTAGEPPVLDGPRADRIRRQPAPHAWPVPRRRLRAALARFAGVRSRRPSPAGERPRLPRGRERTRHRLERSVPHERSEGRPVGPRLPDQHRVPARPAAQFDRCSRCAVFVISAGQNGIIETPFQQPIANANVFGDDIAVRIQ